MISQSQSNSLIEISTLNTQLNFSSLESLIEKIHDDQRIAEKALELPLYSKYKDDPYVKVNDLQ